ISRLLLRRIRNSRRYAKLVDHLLVNSPIKGPQPVENVCAAPGLFETYERSLVAWIGSQPGIAVGAHLRGRVPFKTDQPVGSFRFDIVRGHLPVVKIGSR